MPTMGSDDLVDYDEAARSIKTSASAVATTSFKDFLLRDELNEVIRDIAFEHPNELQQSCIPKAMMGADILCQGKSGIGKTAVFVISSLQQLRPIPKEVSILVLVNTKEMAEQIKREYLRFTKYFKDVTVESFIGGHSIESDVAKLSTYPTIFIGTPGRTLHLLKRKDVSFKHVRHFIIDECDKVMVERWVVQQIFMSTDRNKQTMMFSATFPEEMKIDCLKFLNNPHVITVGDESKLTLHGLEQRYVVVGGEGCDMKRSVLETILDRVEFNQCVIFVRDNVRCTELADYLSSKGFPTVFTHSGLSTDVRLKRFSDFKTIKYRILVTTDLMSRGVDIQDVNLVVNFDVPDSTETYLHRIGRAGRFETKGVAITLVASSQDSVILNEVQSRFELSIEEMKL